MTSSLTFHRGQEHNAFHAWTFFRQGGRPRYAFLYPTGSGVLILTLDQALTCIREDRRPRLKKAKTLILKRADKES